MLDGVELSNTEPGLSGEMFGSALKFAELSLPPHIYYFTDFHGPGGGPLGYASTTIEASFTPAFVEPTPPFHTGNGYNNADQHRYWLATDASGLISGTFSFVRDNFEAETSTEFVANLTSFSFTPTAVPEPTTWTIAFIGGAILLARKWYRKGKSSGRSI